MGDRANVAVLDNGKRVWLYTHWQGSELPATLRAALLRGQSRWTDGQYLARIIFQQMLNGDEGLTGFGISAEIGDNEHPVLVCDIETQSVVVEQDEGGDVIARYAMADYVKIPEATCTWDAIAPRLASA